MQELRCVAVGVPHQCQEDMLRPDILREEIGCLLAGKAKRQLRARREVLRQREFCLRVHKGDSLLPCFCLPLLPRLLRRTLSPGNEVCLRLDQFADQMSERFFFHAEFAKHNPCRAFLLHAKPQKQMLCPDHEASRFSRVLCRARHRSSGCGGILISVFHMSLSVSCFHRRAAKR